MDSHAQWEMQQYANAIFEIIKQVVPISCEAFEDYRLNASKKNNIDLDKVTEAQMQELRSIDSVRAHERRNQVLYQWKRNINNEALANQVTQEEYDTLVKQHLPTDYQIVDHKQGAAPYFRESLRRDLTNLFKQRNPNGTYVYAKKDGTSLHK